MKLSVVAAMSENRVIGRDGSIPWRLRDEQRALRELTVGHCLLMGRKTWDSIGRALPGRASIVITRDLDFAVDSPDVIVALNFEAALEAARVRGETEAFVFGGEAIYAIALPQADRLYLTEVHVEMEGDAFFPAFDASHWKLIGETRFEADARNDHAFTIRRFERA